MFEAAIMCLALNIYHEARDQPFIGQVAVAQVVMNRVRDDRYPDDVCGVVKQGPTYSWREDFPVRNRCQFSWYCDGKSDEPKEPTTYSKLYDMALDLVYGDITVVDITEGATHYHADYVFPAWRKTKTKTIEIEDHIFYRWEK